MLTELWALLAILSITGNKVHTETISTTSYTYTVRVGGTLDEFNTAQRGVNDGRSLFQPNISITIENIGDTVIRSPRVVVNGRRDWSSTDRLLAQIIKPGMTDEEKTWAVWNFVRDNVQGGGKTYDVPFWGDGASSSRYFNVMGTGACGSFHSIMPMLAAQAGVESYRGVVSNGAHAAQKQVYGGSDHYFDAMLPAGSGQRPGHFPLALDNKTIPGVAAILHDRFLIDRCGFGPEHFGNVTYFGRDCNFWPDRFRDPYTVEWELRLGEKVTLTWADCTRPWASEPLPPGSGNGNGSVCYVPKYLSEAEIVEMRSPYPLAGGSVRAEFGEPGSVEISFDNENWKPVWNGSGNRMVTLSDMPEFREPVYTTRFWLRMKGLKRVPTVTAYFQTYLRSLPSLSVGKNAIHYESDTPGKIKITHTWKESSQFTPPGVSPGPVRGSESRGVFKWRNPESGETPSGWEFYLSPREDLLHPLMACYQAIIEGGPSYTVPGFGAFNPGSTYYWRVRARSADGVWGEWSDTWKFTADVPHRPLNVRVDKDILRWDYPGDAGKVKYEVYADNEPGFTPRPQAVIPPDHSVDGPIELASNLLTVVESLELDLATVPKTYFRVVAVDKGGTRGTPSEFIELPHPQVVPCKLPAAKPGSKYSAPLTVRRNEGRWIINIKKDLPTGIIRYGADTFSFRITNAPEWLHIDPRTGELSGTPTASDAGTHVFDVEVVDAAGQSRSTHLTAAVD